MGGEDKRRAGERSGGMSDEGREVKGMKQTRWEV